VTVRTFIFWLHLIAALVAGTVILIMSVTGTLLMYERQVVAWSDRGFRSTPPAPDASRLPIGAVVRRFQEAQPTLAPVSVTVASDPSAPVSIGASQRTFFADAYSGAVLGESSRTARRVMSEIRAWHRWLAVDGDRRPVARAVTGWANLVFLFIVVSGVFLWIPRAWRWQHVKPVVMFNATLRGKARDFNWHNVTGIWCALVLAVVVAGAVPISFPWAGALVYRLAGEDPPTPNRDRPRPGGGRGAARASSGAAEDPGALDGLEALFTRAEQQVPDWRTIGLRLPASLDDPVVFAIDTGSGGQPQRRSTLTIERATGAAVHETFADQSPGRQLRSALRFAHTGELFGLAGQTVAGIASAGGAVLVWTGFALAWRRLRAWRKRRAARSLSQPPAAGAEVTGSEAADFIYGEQS
jgi:uncharacterized iron-regulated membrane protein